jgi:hypothetical protein
MKSLSCFRLLITSYHEVFRLQRDSMLLIDLCACLTSGEISFWAFSVYSRNRHFLISLRKILNSPLELLIKALGFIRHFLSLFFQAIFSTPMPPAIQIYNFHHRLLLLIQTASSRSFLTRCCGATPVHW